MVKPDDVQKAACMSMGEYYRCAAICYSDLMSRKMTEGCPHRAVVWTNGSVRHEQQRRPTGPLNEFRWARNHRWVKS